MKIKDRVRLLIDDILLLDFPLHGEYRATGYGNKTRDGLIETIIDFLELQNK